MRLISKSARAVVATAVLIVGVIAIGGSADAVTTGSVVNNGAGGVTVTYSADQGVGVTVLVYGSSATCSTGFPPQPLYFLNTGSPQPPVLGPSPFTLDGTVTVRQGGPNTTIPNGLYMFCLYSEDGGTFVLLSSVLTTIGTVTPTTTVPTSTSSTTTVVPVTPSITG